MSFEKTSAPHPDDTIIALSSAPGGGTRAIVRVSGLRTRDVIEAVFTAAVDQSSNLTNHAAFRPLPAGERAGGRPQAEPPGEGSHARRPPDASPPPAPLTADARIAPRENWSGGSPHLT